MTDTTTREGWLQVAIVALTPLFTEQDIELPPVRVSVGFPKGGGPNRIGECWAPEAAEDGVPQLFIHPRLGGDPIEAVLGVLVHELIHAVDGCKSKHGGPFRKMALAIGLEGRMTATVPSAALIERFAELLNAAELPPYPHAVLSGDGLTSGPPKQTSRQIKVECPSCGYIARVSRKWIDEVGPPMCPDHSAMEVEEKDD